MLQVQQDHLPKLTLTPRRILVIRNPTSGRETDLVSGTIEGLRSLGAHVRLLKTTKRGDAEELARTATAREYDVVVAAGGDGTVGEVITGLAAQAADLKQDGRSDTDARTPLLAIAPTGTANVLAHEIGLPFDPAALALLIATGADVAVSIGEIADGPFFGAMVGAGFDARVVDKVDLAVKKRFGKGAYVWSAARQFVSRAQNYRVEIDGVIHAAGGVVVSNTRLYAGRFLLAPKAHLTTRDFQVCLFGKDSFWGRVQNATALPLGMVPKLPGVRIVSGRQVTITGAEGEPLQADGDVVARLPVTITARPQALRLIVPNHYVLDHNPADRAD